MTSGPVPRCRVCFGLGFGTTTNSDDIDDDSNNYNCSIPFISPRFIAVASTLRVNPYCHPATSPNTQLHHERTTTMATFETTTPDRHANASTHANNALTITDAQKQALIDNLQLEGEPSHTDTGRELRRSVLMSMST